jgi:threonylcarbamoyladenosine tRNA methylthiotransferase MtaB
MSDMVSPQEKSDRCQRLAAVEHELRRAYFQSLIGRRLSVLVEGPSEQTPAYWAGTSCRYAPVELADRGYEAGQLVTAKAIAIKDVSVLCTES